LGLTSYLLLIVIICTQLLLFLFSSLAYPLLLSI